MNGQKISSVKPIEKAIGLDIYSRESVANVVEEPMLPACLDFFDKNIETCSNDTGEDGYPSTIEIVYDTLDEGNKKIADELMKMGIANFNEFYKVSDPSSTAILAIHVPTDMDDYIEDVANKFLEISNMFQYQDILFGFKNKEQMAKSIDNDWACLGDEIMLPYFPNETITVDETMNYRQNGCQDFDLRYEPNEELFWEHSSYLERHNKYLESIEKGKTK